MQKTSFGSERSHDLDGRDEPARRPAPGKETASARGVPTLQAKLADGASAGGASSRMDEWHMDGGLLSAMGLESGAGEGIALPTSLQGRLEAGAGANLSDVRLHTGPASQTAAQELGARAYTSGRDIHFAANQYQPDSPSGQHLLAHEVAHTVQQSGGASGRVQAKLEVSGPGDGHEAQADRFADHVIHGGPSVTLSAATGAIQRQVAAPPARAAGDLRDPLQFATYEEFAAAFRELGTFAARDTPGASPTGFQVLGDGHGDNRSTTADDAAVPRQRSQPGEQHIDHPTAAWVEAHLPPELRMAVYEIPADCADVAILLRHVWLYARGRTERYGSWTIGAGAGRTQKQRSTHLTSLIRDRVFSGSVQAIVGSAYRTEGGEPIRSFLALAPLLHPGDVLVWEHHDPDTGHRRGGHTQTIQTVERSWMGGIQSISVLQGNQPVFTPQAQEIQQDQQAHGERSTDEARLRALPGRRIERSSLSNNDLRDDGGVWTWSDNEHTTLIAAGPPGGVQRPAMQRIEGERRRRAQDWNAPLRVSSSSTIEGVFEAFLQEVRAGFEGTSTHQEELRTQAPEVAATAGRRLRSLRLSSAARAALSERLQSMARSIGANLNPGVREDAAVFEAVATRLRDEAAQ